MKKMMSLTPMPRDMVLERMEWVNLSALSERTSWGEFSLM